jgi:ankyrin repeat protein
MLVEAGTSAKDPSVLKRHERTMYHWAVSLKNKELFLAAKKAGTPVDARSANKVSALHIAVVDGDPWFTRELLKAGAPVNKSVYSPGDKYVDHEGKVSKGTDDLLAEAVRRGGNLEVVQALLDAGVKTDVKANNYDQGTALHAAAAQGWNEAAAAIIKAGANVNAKDRNKLTPLHLAVLHERVDVARTLVSAGANLKAKDWEGRTPVDYSRGGDARSSEWKEMRDILAGAS